MLAHKQNNTANGYHLLFNDYGITYIGPPCISPRESLPLYITDRVLVKKLVDIPTIAVTHIQNNAPGPPIEMAAATPAMLPIPTVDASAVESASYAFI